MRNEWQEIKRELDIMYEHKFTPDYSEQLIDIKEIQSLSGYAILEFGTPWCGHCQAAMPFVKHVINQQSIKHIKVFDGKGKRLGRFYKVKLWPTLILLKHGHEIDRVVRPTSIEAIEQVLIKMTPE